MDSIRKMQRVIALSNDDPSPCGAWSPATVTIRGDNIAELKAVFAEHYPQHRIVELIGGSTATVMAPIAFIVDVEIPDTVEMTPSKAVELLTIILTAVKIRLPEIENAIDDDPGYRASYTWDSALKAFSLHVITPNSYRLASELNSVMRGIRFSSAPLSTAYIGFMLQDPVLGCPRCVPLYMGPSYYVLRGRDGYEITRARPNVVRTPSVSASLCGDDTTALPGGGVSNPQLLLSGPPGGISGRLFGGKPSWLVPIECMVEFFVKMIRAKTNDYDDICCDVVYNECATLPFSVVDRIIGRPPRSGAQIRTIRFLYWIAKRVCPEEYERWVFEQSSIIAHQFSTTPCTDKLLQRLFLYSVEGDYMSVCDSGNPNDMPTLYHFRNTWKIDHGYQKLEDDISRLVTTFVGSDLKGYMEKNDQKDIYTVMLNEVVRLNYMSTMRSSTVKAVVKMLREDLAFDENPSLVGCNNIVIELTDKMAFVRPGRPEDLVSMSTKLHFKHYPESECGDVRTMFRKLFGDEELRSWYFRLICSLLQGTNPERSFFVMFGCARNGKSGQLNAFEIVFGDYFRRFSSKAMCERKDPSATSPELNTLHGARVAASSELKAGETMEADILKALTGDDALTVRGLFKNPRVLRMMARILIASNHFPVFLNADKALRDRTVLIPMEATFDDIGAPTDEFEQYRTGHFPADKNYRRTLNEIAPKLLSMMVDGYAEYKAIGLDPKPKKVRDLCEGYWHEAATLLRFIADCLEFVDSNSTPGEKAQVPAEPKPRGCMQKIAESDSESDEIDVEDCGAGPTLTEHPEVIAPDVMPEPPAGVAGEPSERPKLTYTSAYDRFTAWALARQMDISKFPRVVFKSLMDCELASMRAHKIQFAIDGWIGLRLRF